jgi:hypothetical protein
MKERLTRTDRTIYAVIKRFGPEVAASLRKIMVLADRCLNAVRSSLRRLIDQGYLERTAVGGPWRPSTYRLLRDIEPDLVADAVADVVANVVSNSPSCAPTAPKTDTTNSLEKCPNCGHSLRLVSRATANGEPPRARLTTDLLTISSETKEQSVSQSVVDWIEERFGRIDGNLRRRFEVAIKASRETEETIIEFFEAKLEEWRAKLAKRQLPFLKAPLFWKALWDGEIRGWKINAGKDGFAAQRKAAARAPQPPMPELTVEMVRAELLKAPGDTLLLRLLEEMEGGKQQCATA